MNTRWLIQYLVLGHSLNDNAVRTVVHFILFEKGILATSLYSYINELINEHQWFSCVHHGTLYACKNEWVILRCKHSGIISKSQDLIVSFRIASDGNTFYMDVLHIPDEEQPRGEISRMQLIEYINKIFLFYYQSFMNVQWLINYLTIGHSLNENAVKTLIHFILSEDGVYIPSLYNYVGELICKHKWLRYDRGIDTAYAFSNERIARKYETHGFMGIFPIEHLYRAVSLTIISNIFALTSFTNNGNSSFQCHFDIGEECYVYLLDSEDISMEQFFEKLDKLFA